MNPREISKHPIEIKKVLKNTKVFFLNLGTGYKMSSALHPFRVYTRGS